MVNPTSGSDSMSLLSSNNLGMSLVTDLVLGINYHSWSRRMRIALGAKLKLGFIDGSVGGSKQGFF